MFSWHGLRSGGSERQGREPEHVAGCERPRPESDALQIDLCDTVQQEGLRPVMQSAPSARDAAVAWVTRDGAGPARGSGGAVAEEEAKITLQGGRVGRRGRVGGRATKSLWAAGDQRMANRLSQISPPSPLPPVHSRRLVTAASWRRVC